MGDLITILIPTYNRARALQAVWPSYLQDGNVKQIIIVNDGSTDNTHSLVQELQRASPLPVELIEHSQKRGQQQSRQIAIAAADTEWVLFGEDDVYLGEGYIGTLLEQAQQLNADIIAGRLVTALVPDKFSLDCLRDVPSGATDSIFDFTCFEADFAARTSQPIPAPFLHTIALIRRSIFDKIAFDPWYRGNAHREETDFYLMANVKGFCVFFTPGAVCFHLRGPISASGGQRINRIAVEYWHFVNTRHMLEKNWPYLQRRYGFKGSVTTWMLGYLMRRQHSHVQRLLRTGYKSTFQGKIR